MFLGDAIAKVPYKSKSSSINDLEIKATKYLHILYGENAKFREGQLDAILSVLNNNRTLVVQKTGWGKSLIYFLSTRIALLYINVASAILPSSCKMFPNISQSWGVLSFSGIFKIVFNASCVLFSP